MSHLPSFNPCFIQASECFLNANDVNLQQLNSVLDSLRSPQLDYADVYFQAAMRESWVLEDGLVKEGSSSIEQGVGVRAISGEKTGFAYSDDISLSAIKEASARASTVGHYGNNTSSSLCTWPKYGRAKPQKTLYDANNPLKSLKDAEKVALLQYADQYARHAESRIEQVIVSLSGLYDQVLVAATDDTLSADIRPLIRFNVTVIVFDNGKREQGSAGGGGRMGYSEFTHEYIEQKVDAALHAALVNLEAKDAPAGNLPVVLGAGWPGVLLHEAVGHGLEGDFNRKGTSAFAQKMGQQVASSLCTVVDNGAMDGRRGSLNMDDEGTPTQETVLIENGILTGYLQDKHNAALMGVASTGNGRRESYAHLPMPRMTNTYMRAGEHTQEDMIASVKKGVFAANFGGGQVDITSGQFVFSASEAYMIENGKITYPIKGATLIGNGPDTMNKISMVGDDLALDAGVGVCGKNGQSVPVGVGQPSLKIDDMTIGGTQS